MSRVWATVGRLWRDHRLTGLLVLALAALALGFAGYVASGRSVVDSLYNTISLLALSFTWNPEWGDIPLSLQLARFLIPAVAAYATFRGILALFREQFDVVRAQTRRNHVVVCGLDRSSLQFVKSLLTGGRKVAVVESDRTSGNIPEARRAGAEVIVGDPTDPDVLRRAGVRRAGYLVALAEDDDVNAAVAALASDSGASELQVLVHIARASLADELTSIAFAREAKARVEWFNIYDLAAKALLNEHRIFSADREVAPHIVVVGLHELAGSVVVNAGRQWYARWRESSSRRLRITVAADGAEAWVADLLQQNPALAEVADVDASEHAPNEEELENVTAVFVCERDDSSSVGAAFAVARRVPPSRPVIVRLPVIGTGFAELLEEDERAIHVFGVAERVLTADLLRDTRLEIWAQMVQHRYDAIHSGAGLTPDDPRVEAWAGLAQKQYEALRPGQTLFDEDSNRAQARDIPRKLRAVGCWFRPALTWTHPLLEFSAEEIELLAQLEHERWMEERRARGWTYGGERNAELKTTPYLLDWDDPKMPEDIKDVDRAFARDIPRWLATTGFEVYRVRPAPQAASADERLAAPGPNVPELRAAARHPSPSKKRV